MDASKSAEPVRFPTPLDEQAQSTSAIAGHVPGRPSCASQAPIQQPKDKLARVFLFNAFAEGRIAHGKAFTPVKHQVMLVEDLANLPQFLCQPGDIVLLAKRPSTRFLDRLERAGFPAPEFVELKHGRIDPVGGLCQRELAGFRPWAWGPDSVELFAPLFARLAGEAASVRHYFNDSIARLYSKAWSADFLRKVLSRSGEKGHEASHLGAEGQGSTDDASAQPWLCSEHEAGVAVDTLEDALGAIAVIRRRGHHRVVVKEAIGVAGHNAIRLWEPEILPAKRQWLINALRGGGQLVVEPWLERELDFSVQLEMGTRGLELCGYTGLINDLKGQYLANWAEADYGRRLPAKVAGLFRAPAGVSERFRRLYEEILSLLEAELRRAGFVGPLSIDAFVYRTPRGDCRLKPVVEINPRYTMGRLTLELMKHAGPGSYGLFRLVNRAQARAKGFASLLGYAASLDERFPLGLEGAPQARIRQVAVCLNDPGQAQVCLATFEVGPMLNLPRSLRDARFLT